MTMTIVAWIAWSRCRLRSSWRQRNAGCNVPKSVFVVQLRRSSGWNAAGSSFSPQKLRAPAE